MSELVSYNGRPVMLGVGNLLDAGVGDLLAYRQEWDPFVAAHVRLWRKLNAQFEDTPAAKTCPPGITTAPDDKLDPDTQRFCWALVLTRIAISDTDPGGILTQWNAWKGKSSADILAGAGTMLTQQQNTIKSVGGSYKDELLQIAQIYNIPIELPPVPSFSLQQQIISRIEGAFISLKGILQLAGYSTGTTLTWVASQMQALVEALTDTAKGIAKAAGSPWLWVGVTAVVVAVGAGLVIYYVPRQART